MTENTASTADCASDFDSLADSATAVTSSFLFMETSFYFLDRIVCDSTAAPGLY
jgi:hypothetical protein